MKAKYTRRQWQAVAGLSRWNVTTKDKPRTRNICAINTYLEGQEEIARLIAAAPDLLETLVLIRDSLVGQRSPVAVAITAWADAAITKATG